MFEIILFSCIDHSQIGSSIAFLTLILAYLAYSKSINDKYDSWLSLLKSLKGDIESHKDWLWGEYYRHAYNDKKSYSPNKVIYVLTFDSLKEIIRRGSSDQKMLPSGLMEELSLFNERVDSFNYLLQYQMQIVTANPRLSYLLGEKLKSLGVLDDAVHNDDFKLKIDSLKDSDFELYALSMQIRKINEMIHVDLIANNTENDKRDKLSHLSQKINVEISTIINKFDDYIPWYAKKYWQWFLIFIGIFCFFFLEGLIQINFIPC